MRTHRRFLLEQLEARQMLAGHTLGSLMPPRPGNLAGANGGGTNQVGPQHAGQPGHGAGQGHVAENLFKRLDTDKSGGLSLEEFAAGAREDRPENAPTPEEIFDKLDKNDDGNLTLREFTIRPDHRPTPAQIFKKLDTDGSGGLSLEEFAAGAREDRPDNAPTPEEIFAKLDRNDDGNLSFREFSTRPDPRPNPLQAFKKLDTDGSRGLSLEEFAAGAREDRPENAPTPEEIFNKLDKDGDGNLTLREFTALRHRHGNGGESGDSSATSTIRQAIFASLTRRR
ncbi:MAG: EF-hand domain-containing protein [Pirellulales bacterium]|nr:EF-hand domain-containing protein [Pirellulales bacterium]